MRKLKPNVVLTILIFIFVSSVSVTADVEFAPNSILEGIQHEISKGPNGISSFDNRGADSGVIGNVIREIVSIGDSVFTGIKSSMKCFACNIVAKTALTRTRNGATQDELSDELVSLCVTFRVATELACNDLIKPILEDLYFIAKRRPDLTADNFCSVYLQPMHCAEEDKTFDWTLKVDMGVKPVQQKPNGDGEMLPKGKPLKVLHLTDIHVDPFYVEGSNANCQETVCCNADSGQLHSPSDAAGRWGASARCNIPMRTLKLIFKRITQTHKDIDVVLVGGDFVPHSFWKANKTFIIEMIKNVSRMIDEAFPKAYLVPTLGNHDSNPVNSFPGRTTKDIPEKYRRQWVLDSAAEAWNGWIPPDSLIHFKEHGYYSLKLYKGSRILVINTNLCYNLNPWLLYEHIDPGKMMEWMVGELLEAEKAGEKVLISGHVPPGSECLRFWSREYVKLVARFQDTITGQFFGHRHLDEFRVITTVTNGVRTAVGMEYLSPSQTTYDFLNPSYRIYYIDGGKNRAGATWKVIDHETYTLNLTLANKYGIKEPKFHKAYNAKDVFGGSLLSPTKALAFVRNMTTDDKLFSQFYRYYYQQSDTRPPVKSCDLGCRKNILCELVTIASDDWSQVCRELFPSAWD